MGVGIFIAACLVVIQGMCIYLICRRYSKKKVQETAINDFDNERPPSRILPPVPPFDQPLMIGSRSTTATPFGSSMISPTYSQVNRKRGNFPSDTWDSIPPIPLFSETETAQQGTEIYSNTSELSATSLHYQDASLANQNATTILEDRFC